jgi:hypothetical protein
VTGIEQTPLESEQDVGEAAIPLQRSRVTGTEEHDSDLEPTIVLGRE